MDKMVKKNYPDYEFKQPPLSLFEIETVPIPDKNNQADSYSQVRIHKSYIAAGMDYYIQIRMTEMLMCKSIGYIYYCEELFVVKHKSKHSCASAIFYELGPQQVIKNCRFDYMCCILLQENKTWHKVLKHFIKTSNIMK